MSSIISGFEYDIFISYRQKDNKYDGWVTEFVDNLKRELEATFKEEVSVYFDINPHDGLLETHDVNASLKEKLRCLVFIPIISQTYCDPGSFAWRHEFKEFIELASNDQFGLKVKLPGGNIANRILPVQIHDLDTKDKALIEKELGGALRAIEFIYREAGVNRPLRSNEENPSRNLNQTIYRNQVNKVANAVKDLINGIKNPSPSATQKSYTETFQQEKSGSFRRNIFLIAAFILLLSLAGYFLFTKWFSSPPSDDNIEKSIAVLPFADMSPGHDQEYLGDGIAQEILEKLSRFNDLVVTARPSSFSFKDKNEDIHEIARKLNVQNILTGSVRKEENQIRVTIELIDASTGGIIYSEPFNYESKRILYLESDIAVKVVEKVKSKLSPGEMNHLSGRKEVNPDAYEAYLRGLMEMNKGWYIYDNLKNAKDYFQKAVTLDTGFTDANAFLSFSFNSLSQYSISLKKKRTLLDSVKYYAEKALEQDENNYLAHLAMSNIYLPDYDYINCMKEIDKAFEIDPAGAKLDKAIYLILLDEDDDDAVTLGREAARSDPLNPEVLSWYSFILQYAGRYDECIAICNQVSAMDSGRTEIHARIGWSYLFKNETKKGLYEWSKVMQIFGKPELAELFLTTDFKNAMASWFKWEIEENEGTIMNKYVDFATIYSYLKDRENTLKYLNFSYKNNDDLTILKKWPGFDFIKNDPEYITLYEKTGFKAYDEYKAGLRR